MQIIQSQKGFDPTADLYGALQQGLSAGRAQQQFETGINANMLEADKSRLFTAQQAAQGLDAAREVERRKQAGDLFTRYESALLAQVAAGDYAGAAGMLSQMGLTPEEIDSFMPTLQTKAGLLGQQGGAQSAPNPAQGWDPTRQNMAAPGAPAPAPVPQQGPTPQAGASQGTGTPIALDSWLTRLQGGPMGEVTPQTLARGAPNMGQQPSLQNRPLNANGTLDLNGAVSPAIQDAFRPLGGYGDEAQAALNDPTLIGKNPNLLNDILKLFGGTANNVANVAGSVANQNFQPQAYNARLKAPSQPNNGLIAQLGQKFAQRDWVPSTDPSISQGMGVKPPVVQGPPARRPVTAPKAVQRINLSQNEVLAIRGNPQAILQIAREQGVEPNAVYQAYVSKSQGGLPSIAHQQGIEAGVIPGSPQGQAIVAGDANQPEVVLNPEDVQELMANPQMLQQLAASMAQAGQQQPAPQWVDQSQLGAPQPPQGRAQQAVPSSLSSLPSSPQPAPAGAGVPPPQGTSTGTSSLLAPNPGFDRIVNELGGGVRAFVSKMDASPNFAKRMAEGAQKAEQALADYQAGRAVDIKAVGRSFDESKALLNTSERQKSLREAQAIYRKFINEAPPEMLAAFGETDAAKAREGSNKLAQDQRQFDAGAKARREELVMELASRKAVAEIMSGYKEGSAAATDAAKKLAIAQKVYEDNLTRYKGDDQAFLRARAENGGNNLLNYSINYMETATGQPTTKVGDKPKILGIFGAGLQQTTDPLAQGPATQGAATAGTATGAASAASFLAGQTTKTGQ